MERPIVTVSQGQLLGTTMKSALGSNYYAFRGIPFAAPPVGPLRYKEPQLPENWKGLRNASKYVGDACIQLRSNSTRTMHGSEDCLYLNVYTNSLRPKRPVMVYIHGGSFVAGTTNRDMYREDYLVTQDIVLVFINYRLGPLGFLSLADEAIPSNLGLRDILFALEWIKENIESFGGDVDNVTIFGSSAGAVICHLFTMIPKAKGLFHKAIIQSYTSYMIKSLSTKFDLKNGFRIAARLGMNSEDPKKVADYLRTVPAEKLVECEDHLLTEYESCVLEISSPYEPVIDIDYSSDPIIPCTIDELTKNGSDVIVMIGHTKDESLLKFIGKFTDKVYKYYNDNIEAIIKNKLKDPSDLDKVIGNVKKFYLKDKPIDRENVWNLIRLTSDFLIHADRRVIDQRNNQPNVPTYVYNFSYMGDQPTIFNDYHGPQPVKGVSHADELSYLFYLATRSAVKKEKGDLPAPEIDTDDRLILERLIRMWYNFAAKGDPTPKIDDKYLTTVWKPTSKNHLYYLDINKELSLCDDKESESYSFYEENDKYFFRY